MRMQSQSDTRSVATRCAGFIMIIYISNINVPAASFAAQANTETAPVLLSSARNSWFSSKRRAQHPVIYLYCAL